MKISKTPYLLVLMSSFALFGCNKSSHHDYSLPTTPDNGKPTTSTPTTPATTSNFSILGYAIDDYVLGGNVKILSSDGKSIVSQMTTGDLGKFSTASLPAGQYQIIITGGKEDLDGLSTTANDQKPFKGELKAWVEVKEQTTPVVVGAISTGAFEYANGDFTKYQTTLSALPDTQNYVTVADTNTTANALQKVVTLQRTLGFDNLISEIKDDGKFNESNGFSSEAFSLAVQSNASNNAISDLGLKQCIENQLQKGFASISSGDLASITRLSCNDLNITSIKGISQLTGLTTLHAANNEIGDISELATLPKLQFANFRNNRITTIKPLQESSGQEVALMIGQNCIGLPELDDTARVNITKYDMLKLKQYAGCNKNDVTVLMFELKESADKTHSFLRYRTSYNPTAQCEIVWGDGSKQPANCEGQVIYVDKLTDKAKLSSIKFYANGELKKTIGGENTSIPVIQNINFIPATATSLAKVVVTFNVDMHSNYHTTGEYDPNQSYWQDTKTFVVEFNSYVPNGTITFNAGADSFTAKESKLPMKEDKVFTFPAFDTNPTPTNYSNVVSGKVTFSSGSIPSNTYVRIVPQSFVAQNIYSGLNCKVASDGTFGTLCVSLSPEMVNDIINKSSSTYQVVVYQDSNNNKLWNSTELAYTAIINGSMSRDVVHGAWQTIIVK